MKPNCVMKECESSAVARHGYDSATKTLAIEFKGGGLRYYHEVPQELYDKLCVAKSIGRFLRSDVISGGFKHTKP